MSSHHVRLPPIRSLIGDVPGEGPNRLPRLVPGDYAASGISSEYRTSYSSSSSGSSRSTATPGSRSQTQVISPGYSTGSSRRPPSSSSSSSSYQYAQQTRSQEISLPSPKHGSTYHSMNGYNTGLQTPPRSSSLSYQQPLITPGTRYPLEKLGLQARTAPQYHQHHLSPKASAMINDQQSEKYVCQQCNKVFSRPSSLKIHGHSHTGEKPFRCPRADCGKTFSVRSNMKRHEKGCHES